MTTESPVPQRAPTVSWPDRARAEWPSATEIEGDGPYAVLVTCHDHDPRIFLCADFDGAVQVKGRYDKGRCTAGYALRLGVAVLRPHEGHWMVVVDAGPVPSADIPRSLGVDLAVQLVRGLVPTYGPPRGYWNPLRVTYEGFCPGVGCASQGTGSTIEQGPDEWIGRQCARCSLCGSVLRLQRLTLAVVEGQA